MTESQPEKRPTTSVEERRGDSRRRVSYRMDVMDAEGALAGCVLDISQGGMRLACAPDLDVGHASSLWIAFPRWMNLGDGMSLSGRFVWCRPDGPHGTEAGFSFDAPSKKQRAVLASLIDLIEKANAEDRGVS